MAIFKEYLEQVTFEEVWAIISAGNPEENEQYREAFLGIFQELRAETPAENKENMSIRFVMEDASEWDFWFDTDDSAEEEEELDAAPTLQVYGFIPGDEEGYAIGMKPPAVLVGLQVDPETAEAYSPAEIVANCLREMVYTSTVAASAYGTDKDLAGGGLLASQVCMQEDIQNIDLDALRRELGALPEHEDYKSKYGFLF